MTGSRPARVVSRRAKWFALAATMMAFAFSAAPASAIMVKLHNGHYANYDAMAGAKAPKAARIFDAAFTNLDYSGGPIMPSSRNYVVEWLPSNYGSHTPFQGPDMAGHVGYVAGVQQFFTDMAADSGQHTNSDAVAVQYNDTSGAHSFYNFSSGGTLVDTDPLPANGCPAASGDICLSDTQLQGELNSFLSAHGLVADLTHEYYLITPPDVASCFDSAGNSCSANADQNQQFCAYHSRTPTGYVYSNIPDLAGVNGCDPFVTFCLNFFCDYNNSPADGVLSAISHEHNESITDPEPNNAWTDWGSSVGGENGDKCNNDGMNDPNLNTQTNGFTDTPYNEVIGGDHYLIQREWSNQTNQCLDSFTAGSTTATASFTQSPGSGNAVTFNAAASTSNPGGVAEYVWQFNDGPGGSQNNTIETTSPTISHTFSTAAQYWVALTVMNSDGTSNGAAHVVTAGHIPPTAAFTAPGGLENVPLTFDGRASSDPNAGGSLTYAWNFGDGGTASGAVVSHPFHAGFYTVTLTVTDSVSALTNTTSHGVFVLDEGPSVAFSPPSGRAQTPVSFTGSGSDPDGAITSYSWTFGDGGTGSGANVTHSYGAAGFYTVTLRVTDSSGLSATVSHSVTISPLRCVVPRLKGDSLSKARTALGKAHCALGKVKSPKKPKRSPGKHHKWVLVVASSNPGAGAVKPRGTKVALKMTWKSVHS